MTTVTGMQAAPRTRRKKRPALLDRAGLESMWRGGRCSHGRTVSGFSGPYAIRSCRDCGVSIELLLRFGRPKTFEAAIMDGVERPIGRASAAAAAEFVLASGADLLFPGRSEYDRSNTPRWDRALLELTLGALANGDGGPEPHEPRDFVAVWRGIDCEHGSVECSVYGGELTMRCRACCAEMVFEHTRADTFDATLYHDRPKTVHCGLHGTDAVMDIVREFAKTVDIPNPMADRMSDDPDRDARRAAGLVEHLERHSLLHRVKPHKRDGMSDLLIRQLSAAVCTRREFARTAKGAVADARARFPRLESNDRPLNLRWIVEGCRLRWPCRFEGIGMSVGEYNPTGMSEYCVRCLHSTLDNDDADAGYWKDGCPKCGYAGYLWGLDDRLAGRSMQRMNRLAQAVRGGA